jgi:CDP-diacylglycerol--glycerol-3-phosphate 3-phosphatidyltransferase
MQGAFKEEARRVLDPVVEVLDRARFRPTAITLAGLALAAAAGGAIAAHRLHLGALCLILSALCDILDGQLARRQGRVSRTGAFLDSCMDRLAEGAVFVGLAVYLMPSGPIWVALAVLGLVASTMVSYARARAEGLGLDGKVGVLERPERLVVLIAALLIGGIALRILLVALTLLAFWTFWTRVRHVERQVRAGGRP